MTDQLREAARAVIGKMDRFASARQADADANRSAPDNINAAIASVCRAWSDQLEAALAAPAPALDAKRLARMLVDSGLMRRYDEYSRDAHPDTMRPVESIDSLATDWALAMLASERSGS